MSASIEVIESGDGVVEEVKKAIAELRKTAVYVGIPQERNASRGSVSDAELLFIHTNGSPLMRIPARPTIEPALEENKERIGELLGQAAIAASNGQAAEMRAAFDDAGTFAENEVIKKFGGSDLAENAQITIYGGWMRNRVSGKPFMVEGKGSSAPLIDTGALRASITHVVETE